MKPFTNLGLGLISFILAATAALQDTFLAVTIETAIMFVSMVAIGGGVVGVVNWIKRIFGLNSEQAYYLSWLVSGLVGLFLIISLRVTGSGLATDPNWYEMLAICFAVVVSTDRYYSYIRRKNQ